MSVGGCRYIFLDEGGNLDFSSSGTKYFIILTSVSAHRPFTAFQALGSYKFDLIEYGLNFVFFHCTEDNRHIGGSSASCKIISSACGLMPSLSKAARPDQDIAALRKNGLSAACPSFHAWFFAVHKHPLPETPG